VDFLWGSALLHRSIGTDLKPPPTFCSMSSTTSATGAGAGAGAGACAGAAQALKASLLLARLVKGAKREELVVADAHLEDFGFTCLVDQVFQAEELFGSTPADRLRLVRAGMQPWRQATTFGFVVCCLLLLLLVGVTR